MMINYKHYIRNIMLILILYQKSYLKIVEYNEIKVNVLKGTVELIQI